MRPEEEPRGHKKMLHRTRFWPCAAVLLAVLVGLLFVGPTCRKLVPDTDGESHYWVQGSRSSKWDDVRDEFVRQHPACEACGSKENLNVHHVISFSERPDLELDTSNLITLCREHHFLIGHDPDGPWGPIKPDWKRTNPNVREHCRHILQAGDFPGAER